jgi:hypothetical protein
MSTANSMTYITIKKNYIYQIYNSNYVNDVFVPWQNGLKVQLSCYADKNFRFILIFHLVSLNFFIIYNVI